MSESSALQRFEIVFTPRNKQAAAGRLRVHIEQWARQEGGFVHTGFNRDEPVPGSTYFVVYLKESPAGNCIDRLSEAAKQADYNWSKTSPSSAPRPRSTAAFRVELTFHPESPPSERSSLLSVRDGVAQWAADLRGTVLTDLRNVDEVPGSLLLVCLLTLPPGEEDVRAVELLAGDHGYKLVGDKQPEPEAPVPLTTYRVEQHRILDTLVATVNGLCGQGWVPHGAMCALAGPHGPVFYQTMVYAPLLTVTTVSGDPFPLHGDLFQPPAAHPFGPGIVHGGQ